MRLAITISILLTLAASARADIYQWEYINPADPNQGKRQGSTCCPSGFGVSAIPGASLQNRNLSNAYLAGADLTGANLLNDKLSGADLGNANLTNANLQGALL